MLNPELLSPEEKLADAKERLALPVIVVLCGSTEFMDDFTEMNVQQTAKGRIVLSVGCNMKQPHPLWADPQDAEELKPLLDSLHKAKIRLADRVIVVGTRIGTSTRSEISYARELGKPVWFQHPEVDPDGAVVAYRNPDRPSVLLCREHGDGWWGMTPLTSEDLPDGGGCTHGDPADPDDVCGVDVLITGPTRATP